jgi:N-acetylmuramoyl-L-alanine amidase
MIAICIGHSRKIGGRYDGGAYSEHLKISERDFNLKVATKLSAELTRKGIPSKIFDHYAGNGYGYAMADVADKVKAAQATLAIELHFNSATPSATGHEWLYWHSSVKGKAIAEKFNDCFQQELPEASRLGALRRSRKLIVAASSLSLPIALLSSLSRSSVAMKHDCKQVNPDNIADTYAKALASLQ